MKILPTCALLAGLLLPLAASAAPSVTQAMPDAMSVKRETPPAISNEYPTPHLPKYTGKQLLNGIPVYCLESHRVPLAHVIVGFRNGGSKNDPVGKYGLASLAMDMTKQGMAGMNALEYSKAMDLLGADLTPVASWDSVGFTASFMTKYHKEVAELFCKLILQPTFPQHELDRLKKSTIDGFLVARSAPETIAAVEFNRLVYGEDSRYGTLRVGTPRQIASITRDDIVNFYRRTVRPENCFICIGGDINPDVVVAELNKSLGVWKPEEPAPEPLVGTPEPAPQVTPRYVPADLPAEKAKQRVAGIYIVDRPGSSQTVIRAGGPGISAKDPDEITARVMNIILGGSFTSRLNMNLREKNGYTYGVTSGFDRHLDPGAFVVSTNVQTNRTAAAIWEIGNEIFGMHKPVSDEELQRAKNYVAYTFPTLFETGASMTTIMCRIVSYGLDNQYIQKFVPAVLDTTPEEILRVADRTLDISKMKIVLVGDAAKIEEQLKKSNLRAQVLTVDEVMGPALSARTLMAPQAAAKTKAQEAKSEDKEK